MSDLPLIEIDIRWEDGEEVEGLLVSQWDGIDEDNDDAIFFYGLTLAEALDCVENKTGPLGSEFVILAARLVGGSSNSLKRYNVTFQDFFDADTEEEAYDRLIEYLRDVVEYRDVIAFDFTEVEKP